MEFLKKNNLMILGYLVLFLLAFLLFIYHFYHLSFTANFKGMQTALKIIRQREILTFSVIGINIIVFGSIFLQLFSAQILKLKPYLWAVFGVLIASFSAICLVFYQLWLNLKVPFGKNFISYVKNFKLSQLKEAFELLSYHGAYLFYIEVVFIGVFAILLWQTFTIKERRKLIEKIGMIFINFWFFIWSIFIMFNFIFFL